MAKFQISGLTETALMFSKLEQQAESVAKQAVGAGAQILADQVAKNLEAELQKKEAARNKRHRKLTGELRNSLGITSVKKDKHGVWNAKVGFDGYGSDGRPLPLIARVIESGTSKMSKRPFIRPAVDQVRGAVEAEMQKVIQEAIDKEGRR